MIDIQSLTVGPFQSNSYLVSCTNTKKAVIIDAGDEAERILDTVNNAGVEILAVVNTHAHLDHVAALPEVVEALKVPVFMHEAELRIYNAVADQAAMFGLPAPATLPIDRWIAHGDIVEVGELRGEVILTPGHSPGSVCLAFYPDDTAPVLIAGDTLFQGSIGRVDLPGGDEATMVRTLKDIFAGFPDEMRVYPGHGSDTTIGIEKETNPFFAPIAAG